MVVPSFGWILEPEPEVQPKWQWWGASPWCTWSVGAATTASDSARKCGFGDGVGGGGDAPRVLRLCVAMDARALRR